MLFLAIVATLVSIVWTAFVVFANGMSSAPMAAFQGGWSIIGVWVLTVILWLAWGFG
jgi:hypothetical protein